MSKAKDRGDVNVSIAYKFSKNRKSVTFKIQSEEKLTDDEILGGISYILQMDASGALDGMDGQEAIN